jgi:C1A family cysteine protease
VSGRVLQGAAVVVLTDCKASSLPCSLALFLLRLHLTSNTALIVLPCSAAQANMTVQVSASASVPQSVDWRAAGKVTPVGNQGQVGMGC